MKTVESVVCAIAAVMVSAILHWILFRPDLPTARPLPVPPVPPLPVVVEADDAPVHAAAPEREPPSRSQPADPVSDEVPPARSDMTPAEHAEAERAAARSHEPVEPALILDYHVDDVEAVLELAARLDLHFVLLSRPTSTHAPRAWPIEIDLARGVMRRRSPSPPADRYLELPTRGISGPLRYDGWTKAARALHELPASTTAHLALAIPNDRLDQAGRAAVTAACAARGLVQSDLVRAILRPAGVGASAVLEVEELVGAGGGVR